MRPLQTEGMMDQEEYPIYYKIMDASPHVDLELEDEWVRFVIDTGCDTS